ncbi:MAG: hypothetical protein ACK4RK_04200 [Gemmataceae bacterium]
MIELTEQQRDELNQPEPTAIDPRTREEYVLVRKAAYQRLKALLENDTILATGELVDAIMAEDDAHAPYWEEYQR